MTYIESEAIELKVNLLIPYVKMSLHFLIQMAVMLSLALITMVK